MKSRRGVSEIVASMIVLVIVSVLGVMLYNISAGTISGWQNDLFYELKFEGEKAQERFEIVGVEKVGVQTEGDQAVRLYLLNFSKYSGIEVTVGDVYVDNLRVLDKTSAILRLEKNSVVELTVSLPEGFLVLNKNYNILVVSERGVSCAYDWIYS